MARIVPALCPNCGAALRIDATQEIATCNYCGTSALIQRDRAAPRAPEGHVIYVPNAGGSGGSRVGAFVALGVAAFVMITAGAIFLAAPQSAPRPRPGPSPTSIPMLPTRSNTSFAGRRPMLIDVNADRVSDVVIATTSYEAGATHSAFAAYDGASGSEIWRTDDLGTEIHDVVVGVWFGHLMIGLANGEVRGYPLATGKRHFGLKLAERTDRFCDALWAAAVRAHLADGHAVDIDLGSGKERPPPGKAECRPIPGDRKAHSDVATRFFPDEDLPSELESYKCGSVTVQGTYNYFFPDQCPKKLGSASLGELDPGGIVKLEGGWAILGKKQPGSAIPMVGLARGGKLVWSAVVPSEDPLSVSDGKPRLAAVTRSRIIVGYEPKGKKRVTAFDVATGKRLYDVELALGSMRELVASDDRVAVLDSSALVVLAADTGKQVVAVGRQ